MKYKRNSSFSYLIESLIPFTEASLNLAFRPNAFFNELEKRDRYSRHTLKKSFYDARAAGFITYENGQIRLSDEALAFVAPAKPLEGNEVFMVIFDIPEQLSAKRRQLRSLLRELHFTQTQKSVWISTNDHQEIVLNLISELNIQPYTKTFISRPVI